MEGDKNKKTVRAREARLTIDCSAEQKKKIKMLAAMNDSSITDFMLNLVEEKFTWCPLGLSHIPNEETAKVLRESEQGINLEKHESVEDFWKSMGIDPNA